VRMWRWDMGGGGGGKGWKGRGAGGRGQGGGGGGVRGWIQMGRGGGREGWVWLGGSLSLGGRGEWSGGLFRVMGGRSGWGSEYGKGVVLVGRV